MKMNKLAILFTRHSSFGKVLTCGAVVGVNKYGFQVQEVLETCYHFWRFRIIIYHRFKFKIYD